MNIKVLIVFLICMVSLVVHAQDIKGREFYKTLMKNINLPRNVTENCFFSIKFTTDKNRKITEMILSDNADSLIRREFERIRHQLKLESLEEMLLSDSEAILPVIFTYDEPDRSSWMGDNTLDFNGSAALNKKYQLLPPLFAHRSRPSHPDRFPYKVKPPKPLIPLPTVNR